MIAGYAAFVPGLAIVYFHNRWTGGWPVLVTVMGWLSLIVGFLRMVPHTDRRNDDENRSVRRRRLSCRRGRIPADRRVPFVQGIRSRVTTTAVLQNGLMQLPHHSWIHDGGDWFKLRS
jgi:hypothetical protein